jgi:hypothetical protein
MVYSDVVAQGLILPRKDKYTMRDVNDLMVSSLFKNKGATMEESTARFIVKCSAIYHDVNYSDTVAKKPGRIIPMLPESPAPKKSRTK